MITPAGKECRFYYEDFNRGRSTQECRVVAGNLQSAEWEPKICSACPVPDILAANGDPNLIVEGTISGGILGFGQKMRIKTSCKKHGCDVENPYSGCTECASERPGLEELFRGL